MCLFVFLERPSNPPDFSSDSTFVTKKVTRECRTFIRDKKFSVLYQITGDLTFYNSLNDE